MKKSLIILSILLLLTACTNNTSNKTPHEILLSIKNYSCKMQISYLSNKNINEYTALQTYSASGKYSMEFQDSEKLKISYENSILNISSALFKNNIEFTEYENSNKNPLFLSYFINTYFNSENPDSIKQNNDSIELTLPNYNEYLYSAKLTFKNNLPYNLTYFDKNGNIKVNIIYNEFISST